MMIFSMVSYQGVLVKTMQDGHCEWKGGILGAVLMESITDVMEVSGTGVPNTIQSLMNEQRVPW